ncbi:MAG: DNA-binding protein [Nitrospirae bacterium]|nr:DNA-binding protein [Nitrospirota bacterium]
MKYKSGSIGRVFVIKFEDGDDLNEGILQVAREAGVKAGFFHLLGGMRSAGMVCGPKEPVLPPEPAWEGFTDGREILGIGSVFMKDGEPAIHLHGAVGKFGTTLTGCVRKDAKVFLVVEALMMEVTGIDAKKVVNEKTGIAMLELG